MRKPKSAPRKILAILLIGPRFLRAAFAPKGGVLVFNHTTRVRKSPTGLTPLYLGEELGNVSPLIIFDESLTPYDYDNGAVQFVYDGFQPISALAGKLFGPSKGPKVAFNVKKCLCKIAFKILQPKIVLFLVWYGKEWAVAAAKELGIETVDLQHGLIFEEHLGYALQSLKPEQVPFVPDRCWVYGPYWKERLIGAGWKADRIEVCGYYLDHSEKRTGIPYGPYLLYVSTLDHQEIIADHIRSIKPCLKERGFKVVIAPHQHVAEVDQLYACLEDEQVVICRDFDSYDLLRSCEACIGTLSTLLYEALVFGKTAYAIEDERINVRPASVSKLIAENVFRPIRTGQFPEPSSADKGALSGYLFARSCIMELLSSR